MSAYIERDQRRLIPLAVAVLAFVLASFFRSAPLVLLPLGVTGVTTAWTLGAYGLAGFQLNAITGLLAPVLMVLSLPVSVHLIQGWLDAEGGSEDRVARILGALRRLLFPCFFCSLTTALGFASLATSSMPAVEQFGLFAALGVALAFSIGMTLVPVGLSFLSPPESAPRSRQHRWMLRLLAASDRAATLHPRRVLAVFCLLTAACLAGLPRMQNNTDLVRFLKSDAPLHRDTLFIDAHLAGSNALEFVVARSDGAPLTGQDDVQRMQAFEQAALAREHVTGVSSILAVLRQLQRAESGGEALVLPPDQRATTLRVRSAGGGPRPRPDPQADRARFRQRALQRADPRAGNRGRSQARGCDPRRRPAPRSATATTSRRPAPSTTWRRIRTGWSRRR